MALSNTATPKYYGEFRDKVLRGEIPVCKEIAMEMNRIDWLIASPDYYYDPDIVEGYVAFCENELTLTDGSDLRMLDSFKLWGEQVFGWWYFVDRNVFVPSPSGVGGHFESRRIKLRLTKKQYLIVARGAAKSMYCWTLHGYFLTIMPETTHQITTAPTMKQAEEVMSPGRTAIARARGPLFKFMTQGSLQNTTGSRAARPQLASTKKGIENFLSGSLLEIRPMTIAKLQGLRTKIATVDEWLSGDIREDVIGALEQGAAKGDPRTSDEYLIVATSSEGTVRNGVGDEIKMELMQLLRQEYFNPHVSCFHYRLDDVYEVGNPDMWVKAQPNIGITVSYEAYQQDVDRAEAVPAVRNDILAKRFGIPMEGYSYFFTYEETLLHPKHDYWQMKASMGADLSQGDDFCAFTFLFPLPGYEAFGVKTRCYITERTFQNLSNSSRILYEKFIAEDSLRIMPGVVLDLMLVYDDLDNFIMEMGYEVQSFGFDPYNAREFVDRWQQENGPFGIEKVIQGARTESVPLGELKNLAIDRSLYFDQEMMKYTMGNAMTLEDTNGNRKLYKKRREHKVDSVAALLDAWVAYKLNKDFFE